MNEFERGGEKILRKVLFGPPIGTLGTHGGRFPGLYMLIGRAGPDKGVWLPIGFFQGGGKKKTRFNFVYASENYKWEYRFVKPIKPYYWKMIHDLVVFNTHYVQKWEYIEMDTGIKPIMPDLDI